MINTIIILIYIILLNYLGYYFSKKQKNSSDYFIGNKKIPAWVAAFSIYATALSPISYIAITTSVFQSGWMFGMGVLGHLPLVLLLAKYFIPFIRKLDAITAYEYLEKRFDRSLRLLASAIFMLFHIFRIAVVIYIPTLALIEVLPNISPYLLIFIMGLLCIIYTTNGGFSAVVWADTIQSFILIGAALLVIFYGFKVVPEGVNPFISMFEDGMIFPAKNFSFNPKDNSLWWLILGAFFGSIYQYIGSQDIVQRYNSTPDIASAKKTLYLQIPLFIISSCMFIGMGSALYLFYKYSGVTIPALSNSNSIFPHFIINQLPIGVSGIVIVAILAAAQSTISSSLNSISTCAVIDFITPIISLSDSKKVFFGKIFIYIAGLLGILLSIYLLKNGQGSIYILFHSTLGLLGGPISGIFILGIFCKNVCSKAAWIGFLTSAFVALCISNPAGILNIIPGYVQPQLFGFTHAPIVLLSCLISGYIASIFLSKKPA